MPNDPQKIKISLDDLASVQVPPTPAYQSASQTGSQIPASSSSHGNLLLKSWVYLGLAGLVASLLGWALMEPHFIDSDEELITWITQNYSEAEIKALVDKGEPLPQPFGNKFLFVVILCLVSLAMPISESLAEHAHSKVWMRATIALILGLVLSFPSDWVANILFTILKGEDPTFYQHMFSRGIAWIIPGVVPGVVYGIISRSSKKCLFGILGGGLGGLLGGLAFDPISIVVGGAGLSRAIGFAFLASSAGIAIGLVESALKDRWLFVQSGPLAGKQFILYKDRTVMGLGSHADILLFKAKGVLPEHAVLHMSSSGVELESIGPVHISGQPKPSGRYPLRNRDLVGIDCYIFLYEERHKA